MGCIQSAQIRPIKINGHNLSSFISVVLIQIECRPYLHYVFKGCCFSSPVLSQPFTHPLWAGLAPSHSSLLPGMLRGKWAWLIPARNGFWRGSWTVLPNEGFPCLLYAPPMWKGPPHTFLSDHFSPHCIHKNNNFSHVYDTFLWAGVQQEIKEALSWFQLITGSDIQ